jgi:adenosylcobinamide-phosphate synthase
VSGLGAAAGVAVDRVAGEPPLEWHPVARFGTTMQRVEHRTYADRRINGIVHLAVGLGLASAAGWLARRVLGRHVGTAAAVALCSAGRMLDDEARTMAGLLRANDLNAARARVRSLVGRNPEALDADELARAVIESVAENLVDAVTATIWWGSVGGAVASAAHRAVNTLDAMVGHHSDRYERFGWAAARVDDLANYLPARLTGLAVALVRPQHARDVWRIVRRDACQHPSPNGGIVEAAFAAALGIRLGGVNSYGDTTEDRGTLGDGRPARVDDIEAAVRLRRDTTLVVAIGALAASGALGGYRRRTR